MNMTKNTTPTPPLSIDASTTPQTQAQKMSSSTTSTSTSSYQHPTSPSSQYQILIIAYPNFNALDLGGPVDVFGNTALRPPPPSSSSSEGKGEGQEAVGLPPFQITVAAQEEIVESCEGIRVARHIGIEEAEERLEDFDLLIMPGGYTPELKKHIPHGTYAPILRLLQKFSTLQTRPHTYPSRFAKTSSSSGGRILLSICTGALFLGYAGIFSGIKATTHPLSLPVLTEFCEIYKARNQGAEAAVVVPELGNISQNFRYVEMQRQEGVLVVDGGEKEVRMDVRVVSSAGISSGIDAALYVLKVVMDGDSARRVADVMQYAWRGM